MLIGGKIFGNQPHLSLTSFTKLLRGGSGGKKTGVYSDQVQKNSVFA
jgi:hypothetical protein